MKDITNVEQTLIKKFSLTDITDAYPIKFLETLSVTYVPYNYSKRYFGMYNNCYIEIIFGIDCKRINIKGKVTYIGYYETFSFEHENDEFLAKELPNIINMIIRRLNNIINK